MSTIDVPRFTRALSHAQFYASLMIDHNRGHVYRRWLKRYCMDLAELQFYLDNGQFTFYTLKLRP